MSTSSVNCQPVLWKYSKNKNGNHPVKIRVTYKRARKYFPILKNGKQIFVSSADWKLINSIDTTLRGTKREARDTILRSTNSIIEAINSVSRGGARFSLERLEQLLSRPDDATTFFSWFETYNAKLLKEGRIGSYMSFNNALSAIKRFRINKDFQLNELNPQMLREFEASLTKKGNSISTVAIYMRSIRAVLNFAANENPDLVIDYPFSRVRSERNKYRIREGFGKKGYALNSDQFRKLVTLKLEPFDPRLRARLFWLFSFYCQGMNFRDMALLKKENVEFDTITYVRAKTKHTETNEEKIIVPLVNEVYEIMQILPSNTNFMLPILESEPLTPLEIDKKVRQFIKTTNKWLAKLSMELEIPCVTTYCARHTYANMLKQFGYNTDLIKEMLGHSDVRTTEAYLKRFEIQTKRAANETLFNSLNK